MSKISELGEGYKNLPNILKIYDENLDEAESHLKIAGKKLEASNKENSAWLYYYDQRRVELHSLVKFFKAEESRVRGNLYKSYKENYKVALGERDIIRYVDSEPEYLKIHNFLIEVEETYEMYRAVVDAFISRNYSLSAITKARIASLENVDI